MSNQKTFTADQLKPLDEMLPITGRSMFREMAITAITILDESGAFDSLVQLIRQTAPQITQEGVEKHLLENFLWPVKLKEQLTPYGHDKLKDLISYADEVGLPKSIISVDPDNLKKDYFDKVSTQFDLFFGGDHPDLLSKNIAVPIAGFLLLQIGAIRLKESEIVRINPDISPLALAEELEKNIEGIIKLHTELAAMKLFRGLVKEKYEKTSAKSKGGRNSKVNKDALFEDFISWALELSAKEADKYSYPINAARDYLKNHLPERRPDLVKHVSSTSARTACDKLQKHCLKNGIKNPLLHTR